MKKKFMSFVSSLSFSINQPEKLESHKNFSFDDMNEVDLLRKGMECHCLD